MRETQVPGAGAEPAREEAVPPPQAPPATVIPSQRNVNVALVKDARNRTGRRTAFA